jgi:hypothetical protein
MLSVPAKQSSAGSILAAITPRHNFARRLCMDISAQRCRPD